MRNLGVSELFKNTGIINSIDFQKQEQINLDASRGLDITGLNKTFAAIVSNSDIRKHNYS